MFVSITACFSLAQYCYPHSSYLLSKLFLMPHKALTGSNCHVCYVWVLYIMSVLPLKMTTDKLEKENFFKVQKCKNNIINNIV